MQTLKSPKSPAQKLLFSGILNSLILSSTLISASSAMALGQRVTAITTSTVTTTSSSVTIAGSGSGAYPSGTNYTLNYAAKTEAITGGSTSIGSTFSTAGAIPLTFVLNRNTGNGTTTSSEIVWSKETSRSGNTRDLLSIAPTTEQAVLAGNNINLGTDNLFTNTGDGNGNNNNVERVDFINTTGFLASDNLVFPVFERGNTGVHDAFKIAAITAVDISGTPTAYGALKTVSSTDYGDASTGFASVVQRKLSSASASAALNPSADTPNSQVLGGVVIGSAADLGISSGTKIFGFSLFGDDVANNADLVNFNSFSTTTTTGGIDLVSANIGAVTLTPITPVPFEFSPTLGVVSVGGFYLGSRLLTSLKKSK
jgi:hypothetical protein